MSNLAVVDPGVGSTATGASEASGGAVIQTTSCGDCKKMFRPFPTGNRPGHCLPVCPDCLQKEQYDSLSCFLRHVLVSGTAQRTAFDELVAVGAIRLMENPLEKRAIH